MQNYKLAATATSEMGASTQGQPLPARLDQVDPERQLPEAIGIGAGGVGLGAFIVFAGQLGLLLQVGLNGRTWMYTLGAAVVAAGGTASEFLRRRKAVTLVPNGSTVGAYRAGKLVATFSMNQLTFYKLNWANTFREVILFGLGGVVASFAALSFVGALAIDFAIAGWIWGVAIALDALAYSAVLTRILSKQYYLPNDLTSGPVAFRKSALLRVGWND